MIVLYIDTSSSLLNLGLVKDDKLIGKVEDYLGKDMSTYALSSIIKMLNKNNIKPNDVDKIIVSVGPGSFTGIRIGVTIAKTFAWSLNKEITPITSLDAMAVSLKKDCYKVPIIDARRGYVYAKIVDKDNNVVMDNKYVNLETLKVACEALGNDFVFITNDDINVDKVPYKVDILSIVNYSNNLESVNPHSVNPIYLKKTEAEENKNIEC